MELPAALGPDSRNRLVSNHTSGPASRGEFTIAIDVFDAYSRRFVVSIGNCQRSSCSAESIFRRMRGSVRQHVRRHCPDMGSPATGSVRRTLRGLTIACDHLQGSPARPAGTLSLMGRVGPSPLRRTLAGRAGELFPHAVEIRAAGKALHRPLIGAARQRDCRPDLRSCSTTESS